MEINSGPGEKRKVRRYSFDFRYYPLLFREGVLFEMIEGFPEGARVEGHTICHQTNDLILFVSHGSFDIVPEGGVPPTFYITVKHYRGKEAQVFKKFLEEAVRNSGEI